MGPVHILGCTRRGREEAEGEGMVEGGGGGVTRALFFCSAPETIQCRGYIGTYYAILHVIHWTKYFDKEKTKEGLARIFGPNIALYSSPEFYPNIVQILPEL